MYEFIEGFLGIEVVVDDFIVIGCGNIVEEVNDDYDKVLIRFLERCKERGVKFNIDKFNFRLTEVSFIGYIVIDKGLCVDFVKVRAISEMLVFIDKVGV